MSKKKNPAAMLAGIVAMVLGVAIIVIAALAVAGIIKIDRPAGSGKVENSSEESSSAAFFYRSTVLRIVPCVPSR